jgi:hypothetical protein
MARGCLTAALVVVALVLVAALLVGPTLYREGKAFVEPVMAMAKIEEALDELDQEFRFTATEGDLEMAEDRLQAFLAVRRELKPLYESWREAVSRIEREHRDSWQGAKEAVASTRHVMTGQVSALRSGRMSPAEFLWLEELVYERWLPVVEGEVAHDGSEEIRTLTEQDLEFIDGLERRFGGSKALTAVRRRLQGRLAAPGETGRPVVPGIASPTQELLWRHRSEIEELDLARYELHAVLGQGQGTSITVNGSRVRFDQ